MRPSMLPSSWAASGLIHASAFGALALGAHRADSVVRPTEVVEFRMDPVPPTTPKKEALAAPHEEPTKAPIAAKPRENAAKQPTETKPTSARTTEPSAPSDGPLDFTGSPVGEQGSFAMTAGTGGGGGGGGNGVRPGPAPSVAPAPSGPTLASREELSRPPAPPDLSARLLASYPSRAKTAGDSGSATLSLVVLADGRVTSLEVRKATSPEFGRACIETVRGSRWQSPLDKAGRATGTRVGYTCTFDVR